MVYREKDACPEKKDFLQNKAGAQNQPAQSSKLQFSLCYGDLHVASEGARAEGLTTPISQVIKPLQSALPAAEAERERMDRMLALFVPSWPAHGTAVISRITQ